MSYGPDVSDFQGYPDWASVRGAGYEFAEIKATEGVGYRASTFTYNWVNAKAAGLRRIAYAFSRPGYGNSPEAEADWFSAVVEGAGFDPASDYVMNDYEDTSGVPAIGWVAWAQRWDARVRSNLGLALGRSWLYTGAWWANPRGFVSGGELAAAVLVLASYGGSAPGPLPSWPRAHVWQFTDAGSVAGISGGVDVNECLDESIWAAAPIARRPPTGADLIVIA